MRSSEKKLWLDFDFADLSPAALNDIERAIVRKLMHANEFHSDKHTALVTYYLGKLADVRDAKSKARG